MTLSERIRLMFAAGARPGRSEVAEVVAAVAALEDRISRQHRVITELAGLDPAADSDTHHPAMPWERAVPAPVYGSPGDGEYPTGWRG